MGYVGSKERLTRGSLSRGGIVSILLLLVPVLFVSVSLLVLGCEAMEVLYGVEVQNSS